LKALALAAVLALAAPAQAASTLDPLEPQSAASRESVSPLRALTVVAEDLEAARRYFQGAFAMSPAPFAFSGHEAERLRAHWSLAPGAPVEGLLFQRPGVPEAAVVRVLKAAPGAQLARPGHDSEFAGPLAMGFPVSPMHTRDRIAAAMGYPAVAGVTTMKLDRGDGTSYPVNETHYRGPDGVLSLGIDRADMRPVGPIDLALGIGGPAYSSAVVSDADAFALVLRDVLGLENRREFTFTSSGPKGGLALPEGARIRFQQWFSPGARTGYVIALDLLNAGKPPPLPLGLQNRGLALWSFAAPDIALIERRARAANVNVLSAPTVVRLPGVGRTRALMLATPDGFPIEVFEAR
jgi:hypothetical protein